jgi:Ca2+/Na+ antiporter
MMGMTLEEIHSKYKDPHGLLVVIVSSVALLSKKKQSYYEPILLALTVVFAVLFLYLSLSEEVPAKSGS